jgi:hypothetical protein
MAAAAVHDDIAERIVQAATGPAWHGPALEELLRDVTAAEAAVRPAAGKHSIGEIVLHVGFWCDDSLRRLPASGAPAVALPEPAEGEDWPALPRLDEQGWKRAVAGLAESHRALAAAVKLLSPDLLPARVPGKKVTFENMLRGVVEHAAYHGGQVAILRRSLRG